METTEIKAHVDWLPHIDFVLGHAVEKVWPHIVDWDRWMPDKVCEHVSGPKDAAGEVKSVDTVRDGEVIETFQAEIVRFEPNRRLAYRILPLGDNSGLAGVSSARGHLIFNIYSIPGERTLLVYESLIEMESVSIGQAEFTSQSAAEELAGHAHWLETYVPELKRMLAGAADVT